MGKKMSFGKFVAWGITIVLLACFLSSALAAFYHDFSMLMVIVFGVSAFAVWKHGPAGMLLFLTAVAVIGVMAFSISMLDRALPADRWEWHLFFGCLAFAAAGIFSIFRWNLVKQEDSGDWPVRAPRRRRTARSRYTFRRGVPAYPRCSRRSSRR